MDNAPQGEARALSILKLLLPRENPTYSPARGGLPHEDAFVFSRRPDFS